MKSTGSVITYLYLIFEFSFQHVLFICIRYYVCLLHILCMKMHYYFLLNIKHGASQLYLGPKYNCDSPVRGRGLEGEGERPL